MRITVPVGFKVSFKVFVFYPTGTIQTMINIPRSTALICFGLLLAASGVHAQRTAYNSPPVAQAAVVPSPSQVCFFEDINLGGASYCLGADTPWIGATWNDKVSSARVGAGKVVEAFFDINYGGRSVTLSGEVPDLRGLNFNDLLSSFKIKDAVPVPVNGGRAAAIPVGIENVNDSPMKLGSYQTMIRFVPRETADIDRIYFGFKLRGANCFDANQAGYGRGNGGAIKGTLVRINPSTGLPDGVIDSETVNGCTRYNETKQEAGGANPVLVWLNLRSRLSGGVSYGLILQNVDRAPSANFFSVNSPLADAAAAGPHARNELNANAQGALMSLDPRENISWSSDAGQTWKFGIENGQYRSYMRDRDTAHPAVRMPQYGFRLAGGRFVAGQPYYAYSTTCTQCSVVFQNAVYSRDFSELGGFTAGNSGVGTLTIKNLSSGAEGTCVPASGYGLRRCKLARSVRVSVGESYSVTTTGSVEVMEMDAAQRGQFPAVGSSAGTLTAYQPRPAPNTGNKDVPNLWAGPLSAFEKN